MQIASFCSYQELALQCLFSNTRPFFQHFQETLFFPLKSPQKYDNSAKKSKNKKCNSSYIPGLPPTFSSVLNYSESDWQLRNRNSVKQKKKYFQHLIVFQVCPKGSVKHLCGALNNSSQKSYQSFGGSCKSHQSRLSGSLLLLQYLSNTYDFE